MITAGVLLRLHDDGLLDIDAPVAAVADWGAGNPTITPAQLLSNSSGLVGLLPDPAYTPYVCQFLAAGTLQDCAASIFSTPDDDADIVAPDTEFRYGGAQWQVAGAVAEVASGKPWAQLIDEIYVQPCGLETLAYNNHFTQLGPAGFEYPTAFAADPSTLQPTDNPNMEGGVYVAPPDYAELLLMHLRGGRCGDTQVLSQAALDRMHADRIGPTYGADAGPGTGYGMGWWVDRASGRISDGGAYGSVPWLDLEDGYGAYLVIEADSNTGLELAQELFDVVEQAVTSNSSLPAHSPSRKSSIRRDHLRTLSRLSATWSCAFGNASASCCAVETGWAGSPDQASSSVGATTDVRTGAGGRSDAAAPR